MRPEESMILKRNYPDLFAMSTNLEGGSLPLISSRFCAIAHGINLPVHFAVYTAASILDYAFFQRNFRPFS